MSHINKEIKKVKQEVKDFFKVYFDKHTARMVNSPETALYYLKDKLQSSHLPLGRIIMFRTALGKIQRWQELVVTFNEQNQ